MSSNYPRPTYDNEPATREIWTVQAAWQTEDGTEHATTRPANSRQEATRQIQELKIRYGHHPRFDIHAQARHIRRDAGHWHIEHVETLTATGA